MKEQNAMIETTVLLPAGYLKRSEGRARQHCEKAARLLGAAEVLYEALGWHPAFPDQTYHDERVATTKAALGDDAFAAAWAEGRAMTVEQVVKDALEDRT
jgi:hypothetical protein